MAAATISCASVKESILPVNVMVMEGVPCNEQLAQLEVARVSYSALPYIELMGALRQEASKVFS